MISRRFWVCFIPPLVLAGLWLLFSKTKSHVIYIAGVKVDISSIEKDRSAFYDACDKWHSSRRRESDPAAVEAAKVIKTLSEKGYRKPLRLLGNHYASCAQAYDRDSADYRLFYHMASACWLKSAFFGDHYSMDVLAGYYSNLADNWEVEGAAWAIVALEFSPPMVDTAARSALYRFNRLSPVAQGVAQQRAKALIQQIKQAKSEYEDFVGEDLEYQPR